jgi:hypothetical protein
VSEWQLVWKVKLEYANLAANGGYLYREVIAETPAQLRRIIEWARRNPAIIAFPYTRIRQQIGERPDHCRQGHDYQAGSVHRARVDWNDCLCGGHLVYLCGFCDDLRIDPPTYHDCTRTDADLLAIARRRLLPQDRRR